MIKVTYLRDFNKVTIEGHALSGEKGHDLVCASASILTHTLGAAVANLEKHGALKGQNISIAEGKATIKCKPYAKYKAIVKLVFDNICIGFELLAKGYPDNVIYKQI